MTFPIESCGYMDHAVSDAKGHSPSQESKESSERLDRPGPLLQMRRVQSICHRTWYAEYAVDASSVSLWPLSDFPAFLAVSLRTELEHVVS